MLYQVIVSDVPDFDGEYNWDPDERGFNGHELHLIKKVSGVRLGEIDEALTAGDYDVLVSVAAITIWRAGKATKANVGALVELLLDAEGGKITFKKVGEEATTGPPSAAPSEEVSSGAANDSSELSSPGSSSTGDDHQATPLRAIGSPG